MTLIKLLETLQLWSNLKVHVFIKDPFLSQNGIIQLIEG